MTAKKELATHRTNSHKKIICIGSNDDFPGGGDTGQNGEFPGGDEVRCNGTFITVDTNTNEYTEQSNKDNNGTGGIYYEPHMGYYTTGQTAHGDGTWHDATGSAWYIRYGN